MAGMPEACALLRRHTRGQQNRLLHGNHRVFRGGAEKAVSLRRVTPHALPGPLVWYTFADGIHDARAVAVRDDTRVGHAGSERVLTLLHVARVYARSGNANPHLLRERLWLVHLADGLNVARRALLFIPCPYKLSRVGLSSADHALTLGTA